MKKFFESSNVIEIASRLALGTVQFGLNYGVSNASGQVSKSEAFQILDAAHTAGVETLDTARVYGTSEGLLGEYLKKRGSSFSIMTKVSGLATRGLRKPAELREAVALDIKTSLETLGVSSVDVLLLHDEGDLLSPESSAVWDELQAAVARGQVKRIGVSSYRPENLLKIFERYPLSAVQVPCNLLDRRFLAPELLSQYRRYGTEVYARSVFLQGLFFLDEKTIPNELAFARSTVRALRDIEKRSGGGLGQASLALCLQNDAFKRVLIGVTSCAELKDVLTWPIEAVPADLDRELAGLWKLTEGRILNPSQWKD
jgi:aryl-alcohol dehydrogenase-like predicted oxidoreductase